MNYSDRLFMYGRQLRVAPLGMKNSGFIVNFIQKISRLKLLVYQNCSLYTCADCSSLLTLLRMFFLNIISNHHEFYKQPHSLSVDNSDNPQSPYSRTSYDIS